MTKKKKKSVKIRLIEKSWLEKKKKIMFKKEEGSGLKSHNKDKKITV